MKDVSTVPYHKLSEELVNILRRKTQNEDSHFFRIIVSYYLGKIASMMRCNINTPTHGEIPINIYAINLATSGYGKGHSMNIMEDEILASFKKNFLSHTFPHIAEMSVTKLSKERALIKGIDPDVEFAANVKEFAALGPFAFSFDSGTVPAVKQMRHKMLMADAGSMCLEIDEIGSNLLNQAEVLATFLELYDVGKVKQKLTKSTSENSRNEEIDGKTPTNMMLFGTPDKLLNGGRIEEEALAMFETGYSRRCLFGYAPVSTVKDELTPEQVYNILTDTTLDSSLNTLAGYIALLSDVSNFNHTLEMSKSVSLLFLEYKLDCEKRANKLPEHEGMRKAELSHRYFKALKLAGAYAFLDQTIEVTEDQLYSAIRVVEDSGEHFKQILTRDRNYVKLAKFISNVGVGVTHADIVEHLPFYKGSASMRQEMLNLAISWGYKNNVIIKKQFDDGIEILSGESLEVTELDKMIVSYSTDYAYNYLAEKVPFSKLPMLTQTNGYHWASHHFIDGHRTNDCVIPGFNMIVLDVENSVPLAVAMDLLKDYKAIFYTTKRHQTTEPDGTVHGDRYRIIMPLNYTLKMDAEEFREFMENIFEWLPFSVDAQTNQRARKWECFNGICHEVDGQVFDALPFIPKTSKNEDRKKVITSQQSLSNLERWFLNNTGNGNRSKQLIRYALILVDSGQTSSEIETNVLSLNNRLPDKLTEHEIRSTILITAAKAITKRDSGV